MNKLVLTVVAALLLVGSAVMLKQSIKPASAQTSEVEVFNQETLLTSKTEQYPAVIRLVDEKQNAFCSGSVISDNLVVTAAHCVGYVDENVMQVVVAKTVYVKSLSNVKNVQGVVATKVIKINPRADYALLRGDFRKFKKLRFDDRPTSDILNNNYNLLACGFPWGGQGVCYPMKNPMKFYDTISADGQLLAGMSGGPVIDTKTGTVYAVNSAVWQNRVIIAPIINILGIQP